MLPLAAQTIIAEVGAPPSGSVFLFTCPEKLDLARSTAQALEEQGIEQHLVVLGPRIESTSAALQALVRQASDAQAGLIFLLSPAQAPFLFDTIGRPDEGLRIPERFFFCDWMLRPEGLLRTLAVDRAEVIQFRADLLSRLHPLQKLRLTTPAGTDLSLRPRRWLSTLGEVFTAPLEVETNGVVVIDACIYSGPPARPIALTIESGRITNLDSLDRSNQQLDWLYQDLTRDLNACILAELGIGINPGALWDQDLMESEQARGTCHVGFGNNHPYGGQNASATHVDLVMRSPLFLPCHN